MTRVITISREFGSGGRELGRRLSEALNMAYYDREIITEISKRTDLAEKYIDEIIERRPITPYPIHIGRSFYYMADAGMDQRQAVVTEQNRVIREMAERSDCVIVGRCGDYILRDRKPLRIFVYCDMETKIARCRAKGTFEEELTDRELKAKIEAMDKNRRKYYEYYTGNRWGDPKNYDICVNTGTLEIKPAAAGLAELLAKK